MLTHRAQSLRSARSARSVTSSKASQSSRIPRLGLKKVIKDEQTIFDTVSSLPRPNTSDVKKENNLRKLTRRAIEETVDKDETIKPKDTCSITSSLIRRRINDAAHSVLPKHKGDAATKLAETQMTSAQLKAKNAAIDRLITGLKDEAVAQKRTAEDRRAKNQRYDKQVSLEAA